MRQPISGSVASNGDTARFDLAWFWSTLKPYRPQLAVLLLNGLVAKLLELVFPLAILQIIDVVVGSRNGSLLLPIGLVLGLTAVVIGVLSVLKQLLLADLSDRIDTTLGSLANLLESLGLEARPLSCPTSHLHRLEAPALLQRGERFVVLERAGSAGWQLADPGCGRLQLSLEAVKLE